MSVVTAARSDILQVGGDRMRVLVEGNDSGEMFEMFVVEGDQGSGPPPHAHAWFEAYFILDGQLLVEIGDERTLCEAGASAQVPPGSVHRFEVTSETASPHLCSNGGCSNGGAG